MSKYLTKSTETYRIDSEEEVISFQEEVRQDSSFEVSKFQWSHKITKKDDYYKVVVEKTFIEDDYFEGE